MDFIPDDHDDLTIPYFEDSSASLGVVGHSTNRSERELKVEIERAVGHLGASIVLFQAGKFGNRFGYRIEFLWGGSKGRIDVAALPLRKETSSRISQAKRHALYSVMMRLMSQFNSQLVMPGDVPLVPYMLDKEGRTLIEAMREQGQVPALPAPEDIVDGDWRENNE